MKIVAPPLSVLLELDANDEIVESQYAKLIKSYGFKIITWTFERTDLRRGAKGVGFYWDFDKEGNAVRKDSDMYKALDVLARKVKILGIFSTGRPRSPTTRTAWACNRATGTRPKHAPRPWCWPCSSAQGSTRSRSSGTFERSVMISVSSGFPGTRPFPPG